MLAGRRRFLRAGTVTSLKRAVAAQHADDGSHVTAAIKHASLGKAMPTSDDTRRGFAQQMARLTPAETTAVRVELWRTEFDSKTMKPHSELLNAIEIREDEF